MPSKGVKMGESMRGSRLGHTSYEVDPGIFADRQLTTYVCANDHRQTMPFSAEADEIPDTWNCSCGLQGVRLGTDNINGTVADNAKTGRTHWDMLLERRTVKELEELLKERLALLRTADSYKKSA